MNDQRLPRISVLMPVYDAEAFVGRAIDSVRAQTMEDWELVVVDDGSRDGSAAVVAARCAQDSRIHLHRQANRGIGNAMNQALSLARAPWVAILDSDDLMYPERLARQLTFLSARPEITAVGSQFHTIDLADRITGLDRHPVDSTDATEFMYGYFCLHHPTITARRAALLEVGGYREEPRRGCPDYRIFMDLVLAGHRLANMPEVLTAWRHSPQGATFGNSRQQTEDALDVRARAFTRLLEIAPDEAFRIARRLGTVFPAGTELDDKARWLGIENLQTPYLSLLAGPPGESLEPLSREALAWFAGRATAQLPAALMACGEPALAALANAHAGHGKADALPRRQTGTRPTTPPRLRVRVRAVDLPALRPTQGDVLASLPAGSLLEVLHETPPSLPSHCARPDLEVRDIAADDPEAGSWTAGLLPQHSDWVGFLEPEVTPTREFWNAALERLQSGRRLVHAQPERWFPDACDTAGAPLKDPGHAPRWTPDTLLGQRRTRLGHLVCKADALDRLPRWVRATAPAVSPLLSHLLLMTEESEVLGLANREWAPAIGTHQPVIAHLRQALGFWYLDGIGGLLPTPAVWEGLDSGARDAVIEGLERAAHEGSLRIHPGNLPRLCALFGAYAAHPLRHAAFRKMLASHPSQAVAVLKSRGPLSHRVGQLWSIAQRVARRLTPRAPGGATG